MTKPKSPARKKASYTVAIDLGGTKLLVAVTDEQHRVLASTKVATDVAGGADAIVTQMVKGIRKATRKADIKLRHVSAIGACVPGPADPATGMVSRAVNLGWDTPIPLAAKLSRALNDVPVFLENDVNAGTYGEFVAGAAQGKQDVVGVFVGTGIGGGLVLSGALRRGPRFIAGEVGHFPLQADGLLCSCGNRGCVETLASRTALERNIQAALAEGQSSVITELMEARGKSRITSGLLQRAFQAQDPLVVSLVAEMAHYLGLLTATLVNILDPQLVVFGGGVVEKMGDNLLDLVRAAAYDRLMMQQDFHIKAASLGDYAGVIGVAALAREAFPAHD